MRVRLHRMLCSFSTHHCNWTKTTISMLHTVLLLYWESSVCTCVCVPVGVLCVCEFLILNVLLVCFLIVCALYAVSQWLRVDHCTCCATRKCVWVQGEGWWSEYVFLQNRAFPSPNTHNALGEFGICVQTVTVQSNLTMSAFLSY